MHPDPFPERDRRRGIKRDTGERRRWDDEEHDRLLAERRDFEDDVRAWMREHDRWAKDWTARMEERVEDVEGRADLLDGKAGNDGGILGQMGELRGELKAAREEIARLSSTATHIDGAVSQSKLEKGMTIAIPILIATLPVLGTIVAAWLALKGQLASVPK